ncbi:amidohydrolase family protein [Bradyrhizobium sp. 157]|uniref:amidohydrolase family protein n=1 Tax=Bradyrhizobium sp. 157 TaxID=2782631 RepID=UPI001FFA3E55|nr:amidohydrolase family protein [Bradyrhizobium sp. 157]MCK1641375.1 amidohydrolase family protein [Bradyrhizobium sp. 157]
MPKAELQGFLGPDLSSDAKYRLVATYWDRIRHTGYAQAERCTLRGLYGEDDLTAKSVPRIAEKYRETVQPGFYAAILRRANIENCQVNSLQRIFMKTEQPALLAQDLSILEFSRCSAADIARVHTETGKQPTTLDDWLDIIVLRTVREPWRLNVRLPIRVRLILRRSPRHTRRGCFCTTPARCRHDLGSEDLKSLQDFLFRYCVSKAGEYDLPVKLHTGFLGGTGSMHLARTRDNASDLCRLLQDFPETRFVLMHIGYPYEQEFIALAKHYPNAWIDMCWAWILNPAESVRFLKEFLLAAAANKIFTFGGDYVAVEPVYGHACIARRRIAQTL